MSKRNYTGMNLPTTLLAIFVTLKLTDNIDWSWWWVLAPLWIPIGIGLSCLLVFGVVYYSVAVATRRKIRDMIDTFSKQ
jgi:hypothetical protein